MRVDVELTEVANYFAFLSVMGKPFAVPAPPDAATSFRAEPA